MLTQFQIDEIIDMLLDQEGFECDPINRREGDTPLHSAVRWANELPSDQQEYASSLLEMMLEAGSDPRLVFEFLSSYKTQTRSPFYSIWLLG